MAYTKKTLANLKQALADKHDSGTLPTDAATLAYWVRLLNEGLAYCTDEMRLVKSASIAVSSGSYTLPDEFLLVDRVVNGDGIQLLQISQEDSVEATGLCYWITGDHDSGFFLKMPTENDDTYTLYYTFRPEEMSVDADVCIVPDPIAVVQYAYATLRRAETDPLEDADAAMGDCERRITRMKDSMQENAQPLGFTIQDTGVVKRNWEI